MIIGFVYELIRISVMILWKLLKLVLLSAIVIGIFLELMPSHNAVSSIGSICNRIDGCPIVDGVCIGCK